MKSRDPLHRAARTNVTTAVHGDVVWKLAPRVEIVPGVRIDTFSGVPGFDPRLAAGVTLSERVTWRFERFEARYPKHAHAEDAAYLRVIALQRADDRSAMQPAVLGQVSRRLPCEGSGRSGRPLTWIDHYAQEGLTSPAPALAAVFCRGYRARMSIDRTFWRRLYLDTGDLARLADGDVDVSVVADLRRAIGRDDVPDVERVAGVDADHVRRGSTSTTSGS